MVKQIEDIYREIQQRVAETLAYEKIIDMYEMEKEEERQKAINDLMDCDVIFRHRVSGITQNIFNGLKDKGMLNIR